MTNSQRYRLRFSKRNRLRFISHRDLLRTFERALRRATLRVTHTQGFNPRPKLTFAQALSLGVESIDEIVDIELEEAPSAEDVLAGMTDALPDGLKPHGCKIVPKKAKLAVVASDYQVSFPDDLHGAIAPAIERFHLSEAPRLNRERKGKIRVIPLDAHVSMLRIEDQELAFRISVEDGGSLKASELLTWLGFDEAEVLVRKVRTILQDDPDTNPENSTP